MFNSQNNKVEKLFSQLETNIVAKEKIERLLIEAYTYIQELRKMSFDKEITIEFIEKVENFFRENLFDPVDVHLPKYLNKYAICINLFWNSYSYFKGKKSRGKFNLFDSLKEIIIIKQVHYFENEFSIILRKMEDYWIASSQLYTKYEISKIRKEYIR